MAVMVHAASVRGSSQTTPGETSTQTHWRMERGMYDGIRQPYRRIAYHPGTKLQQPNRLEYVVRSENEPAETQEYIKNYIIRWFSMNSSRQPPFTFSCSRETRSGLR
ncbi:hypothetical protein [Chlorobaculum limnaeum]|uniref:hypothetical protein n=1 Tax=Chlorobaculum limnaeum TaxID=274537 RepID=UPI001969BC2D|nr:hypothetical protein [Chlorobaculum limnaeum]